MSERHGRQATGIPQRLIHDKYMIPPSAVPSLVTGLSKSDNNHAIAPGAYSGQSLVIPV